MKLYFGDKIYVDMTVLYSEDTWYLCYVLLFSDALSSNSLSLLKHSSSSGRILRKRIRVCPFVNTFWVSATAICQTLWLTWKREKWLELTLATPSVRPRRYLVWLKPFVIYSLVCKLLLIPLRKKSLFVCFILVSSCARTDAFQTDTSIYQPYVTTEREWNLSERHGAYIESFEK